MYADIMGQIVLVAVPEGASVDVRLEVERVKQVIGSELATSSSTCYLRSWRRFSSYWMDFLPAKVDTVLVYFGNLVRLNSYFAICHFHKFHSHEVASSTEA